jgi:sec-independent protein translocase protein TatA
MPELAVILVIALIIFGGGKLPEVMGSMGKGLREFKKSLQEPLTERKSDISLKSDSEKGREEEGVR